MTEINLEVLKGVLSSAISDAIASAATAGASAGTANARTQSNAESDAKDATKTSFVAEQTDSDTNAEEAYQAHVKFWEGLNALNAKRTYDLHQTFDSDGLSNFRDKQEAWHQIRFQAAQNAVETANMIAKDAVKSQQVQTDRVWNIDEVSQLSAKSGVQADAFVAILADRVASILSEKNS